MSKGKPNAPRESDIQRAIMDYLGARRFRVFRRNVGSRVDEYKGKRRFIRFSQPGASDLWGWSRDNGRHFEIEVKRPGARTDPVREARQRAWLYNAKADGAVAFEADSVEDCERQLKEFGF